MPIKTSLLIHLNAFIPHRWTSLAPNFTARSRVQISPKITLSTVTRPFSCGLGRFGSDPLQRFVKPPICSLGGYPHNFLLALCISNMPRMEQQIRCYVKKCGVGFRQGQIMRCVRGMFFSTHRLFHASHKPWHANNDPDIKRQRSKTCIG